MRAGGNQCSLWIACSVISRCWSGSLGKAWRVRGLAWRRGSLQPGARSLRVSTAELGPPAQASATAHVACPFAGRPLSAALLAEELLQKRAALLHQHATEYVDAVIEDPAARRRRRCFQPHPARGSHAPNTNLRTRAWMIADAHITQGSNVT